MTRTFKTLAGLLSFLEGRGPGGLHIHVLHDHDSRCTPNACVCKPWYRVTDLTVDGFVAAERAQADLFAASAN